MALAAAAGHSVSLLAGTVTSSPRPGGTGVHVPRSRQAAEGPDGFWSARRAPSSPISPAGLLSPPGTEINEERLWQAGLYPPPPPGSAGRELHAKYSSSFADCQSGLGMGRFSTFLESTSDSSNYR